MGSQGKVKEATYKGTKDLESLLRADEWSPTSLFPQARRKPQPHGPYLKYIELLSKNSRPDLRYLWTELERQNWGCHAERSRVVVIEYSSGGSTPVPSRQKTFPTPQSLKAYLGGALKPTSSRLYIVEDISRDYVEAIGAEFSIEPSFWAQHLRTTDREMSKTATMVSALPTMKTLDPSFSLIYPEFTVIDEPADEFTEDPRIRNAESLFADCNLYRKIDLIHPGEFYDGVAKISRRASYWSRTNPGGSWDSIILVDPPLGPIVENGSIVRPSIVYSHDFSSGKMMEIKISHCSPYQGGYIDFIRGPVQEVIGLYYGGPPRISLFDDLVHYHTQPTAFAIPLSGPDGAAHVLKKIIAATWMNSIAYVGTSVASLELAVEQSRQFSPSWDQSNDKNTSYRGLEWLEKNLAHINLWKRRCSRFHDWAQWNIQELQIVSSTAVASTDMQDWNFIKQRLQFFETQSRDIVASALGLLSLIESHKSVEEAESTRVLALLGTVYLPLSLAAGILSMGGSFTPGQSHFWIFFAISGPMMVVSWSVLYYMTNMVRVFKILGGFYGAKNVDSRKRTPTFVNERETA